MNPLRSPLFLLLLVCIVLCGLFFGYQYYHTAELAYQNQIKTVQNLAGAVLDGNPELEGRFMDALQGTDFSRAGTEILAKYGYDQNNQLREDDAYSRTLRRASIQMLLFSILILCFFFGLWFLLKREQERNLQHVLSVTEQYLAEDYRFSSSPEDLNGQRRHPTLRRLSDTLKRLGTNIRLKNAVITAEQEHTKSLVTDISHQLKTPIAALKLCFSMYLEADNEAEQEEFLQRSQFQIEKLEGLTAALMNISRLESAMIELRPEPVCLSALLTGAADAIWPKAQKRNIVIETLPYEDMKLCLDPKWTTEALMNVLDNGIKYSPKESVLTVQIRRLSSMVQVEITDQGMGLGKEECTRVFGRFYRGSHPDVKRAEGSGVGLYLTRSILEKQGGGIRVKSVPGKGSTFILQLPMPIQI